MTAEDRLTRLERHLLESLSGCHRILRSINKPPEGKHMTDKPETVADVAVNIRRAVEYIEKQYPGAKTLNAAPILRNMKRWADRIERAMAASAAPDDWRKRIVSLERGFEFDEIMRVHTPTVILRFSSIDSRNPDPDAQGWQDRDAVAALIVRASPAVPVESPPASVPDGWMPIESAPKDGETQILLCYVGKFRSETYIGIRPIGCPDDAACDMFGVACYPMHWMPLPAPPTTPEPRT